MAYIDWSPAYDLGIAEIDRQHRRLVEIVNRLHDAMEQRSPKSAMQGVACDLATYTEIHFAYEERLMQSMDLPDWEAHRSEHRVLAHEIRSFEADLATGRLSVSMDLMAVLRGWLLDHVLRADRELVDHAKGLRSGATLLLSR
jgi:hemerythrin-like metal-binding protein